MILESIELENIRSYQKQKIEFPKGITLFEGDIGSGKSSILMGIEFALFGTGSQKGDSLLSKNSKDGSITLCFSVDGTDYEIRRGLKRTPTSVNQNSKECNLKIDGENYPLAASELKQEVLKILKFNEPAAGNAQSRIFRYAVFTPQREMSEILMDAEKRLETIRRAFGVEDYKKAIENATRISSLIKTRSAILQERFRNIPELQSSIDELEREITNERKKEAKLVQKKKEKDGEKTTIIKKRNDLTKKNSEKREIEIRKDNSEGQLESKKSEIETISDAIEEIEDDIEGWEGEITDLKEKKMPTKLTVENLESKINEARILEKRKSGLESKKSEIETISDAIEEIEDDIEGWEGEITDLKEKKMPTKLTVKNLESKINEARILEKRKSGLESDKNRASSDVSKLKKLGTKCLVCHQTITKEHSHKLVDERKHAMSEIEAGLNTINKQIIKILGETGIDSTKTDDATGNLMELKDDRKEYDDSVKKISELKKLQKKSELKLTAKEKEKTDVKKELGGLDVINKQIIKILGETGIDSTKTDDATGNLMELKDDRKEYDDSVKKISELKKLQKKSELKLTAKEKEKTDVGNVIDGIKNKITEFEESINSLPDYEAELKIVESKERKIDSDLLDIANNLGRIQIVNKQKEITDTKLEIKESEKWNKKHKKLGDYYTWLKEFFIPTVAEIEKQVLISIQQNFNETYRKWFRVLIDDPSKESRIDEHFTPIIEQDGYEQNVYYLSGGEITSVSLAYRLTLNMTMRQETESMNSNLLILDEPTDGFSKNQLSKVKDVLREMNSEQIILVSHEAELETYVDNVFQISKSEGYSRVTRMN